MFIEPTYTSRQYWLTILLAGIVTGILTSLLYISLYWLLYVQQSFIFSLIYLIPLLCSSLTVTFFKHRFVWNNFSYASAFKMLFCTGALSALIFSIILFVAYNFFIESRIDLFNYMNSETLERLMSPLSVSLSMFFTNIILSLLYSLIIAIFAKIKIKT